MLATEWIKGKQLSDAAKIKNSDIAKELSLPPVKLHCSMLAEDAIQVMLLTWSLANCFCFCLPLFNPSFI